jgi:hypothetical protein
MVSDDKPRRSGGSEKDEEEGDGEAHEGAMSPSRRSEILALRLKLVGVSAYPLAESSKGFSEAVRVEISAVVKT